MASITWLEENRYQAWLTSSTPTALPELHALAEALQPVFVDSIGPAPAWPTPGGISFDVGEPEMSGSIGGHPWTVDTSDESLIRALYPRVDGVLLQGIDSSDPPVGFTNGFTMTAVMGGVLVLAILPADVDHAVARLQRRLKIGIAGYHWPDRTGIVVPVPHGLDVTSIDFVAADDTPLHRIQVPEFPPVISGASIWWEADDLVPPPPTGTPRPTLIHESPGHRPKAVASDVRCAVCARGPRSPRSAPSWR